MSGLGSDPRPLDCPPEGPSLDLDPQQLRAGIAGAWRVCEGELLDPAVRGIVFDGGGRWTVLRELGEEIVADYTTAGPALEIAEGSGSAEIALWLVGGGLRNGEVELFEGPRLALALAGTEGHQSALLVPARAGPAPFDGCTPEVPARLPRCGGDVTAWLTGRWRLCSGEPPFGAGGPVGLEVRPDGSWTWLRSAADGGLEPDPELKGPASESKDLREDLGPAGWRVELVRQDGGVDVLAVAYHPGDPPRLTLSREAERSFRGVYVSTPP